MRQLVPLLALATLLAGCDSLARCRTGQTNCAGACVDLAADPSNCGACGRSCGAGSCQSGSCVCSPGATDCGTRTDACVDLQSDPVHCGVCGTACVSGSTCVAGGCSACPVHQNGLGQTFVDCAPLGIFGLTQAQEAAKAWRSTGTAVDVTCPGSGAGTPCFGWQSGPDCGTWCYTAPLAGNVYLDPNLCSCLTLVGHWN